MSADDRRHSVRRFADRETAAGRPAREYYDSAHVRWRVFEVPGGTAEGGSWPPSLIFESAAAVRRVRDFPAEWRALNDAELEALSWRA